MTVGLYSAIALALFAGSGQQSFFMDPNVKKDIKIYVTDKYTKIEIFSIIDVMEKEQEDFLKQKKKHYEKEVAAINADYYAERETFNSLFSTFMKERKSFQSKIWDTDSKIRFFISDKEWSQMMDNLTIELDKDKVRKSLNKVSDKMFDDLKQSCNKIISDTFALSNAIIAIDEQKVFINQIIDEYLNLDFYHIESLQNRNASLEDFEKVTENINSSRMSILTHYYDLRFDLIKGCKPKEWSKLSKEFTKVFIKGKGLN